MQRALSRMPGDQATKFAYSQKFWWETENLLIGALGLLRHKLGARSHDRLS